MTLSCVVEALLFSAQKPLSAKEIVDVTRRAGAEDEFSPNEFAKVRESEVAAKPTSIDYLAGAGVPTAASTAWQALFDSGGLNSGQKILVHGDSGGVGGAGVQLAKWKGAYVIGTASQANLDRLSNVPIIKVLRGPE